MTSSFIGVSLLGLSARTISERTSAYLPIFLRLGPTLYPLPQEFHQKGSTKNDQDIKSMKKLVAVTVRIESLVVLVSSLYILYHLISVFIQ